MAKYTQVNQEHQKKYDALFEDCQVFWAFSKARFLEGAKEVRQDESDRFVSIGMGGYLPKRNFDKLTAGLKEIKAWKKQAMAEVKAEDAILYELNNHECFYSCDITEVVEMFAGEYTEEQVRKVYQKYSRLEHRTAKAQEGAL